jgi:hypothetical protein
MFEDQSASSLLHKTAGGVQHSNTVTATKSTTYRRDGNLACAHRRHLLRGASHLASGDRGQRLPMISTHGSVDASFPTAGSFLKGTSAIVRAVCQRERELIANIQHSFPSTRQKLLCPGASVSDSAEEDPYTVFAHRGHLAILFGLY